MKKRNILSIILLFAITSSVSAYDFKPYSKILKKYLQKGKVKSGIKFNALNYKLLYKEKSNPLSDYSKTLKELAGFNPSTLAGRNKKIAFWINVYNIGAIKMILDNYPVGSIRSMKISFFKNPWNKKIIKVNKKKYSLSYIEHKILLGKYRALNTHFGIVCASLSCPDLSIKVYTGKNYKNQLYRMARLFFKSRQKGIIIDKKNRVVKISKIFKFDKRNFPNGKKDIIPFIIKYIDNNEDKKFLNSMNYKLKYLSYNWDLNTK